MRAQRIEGADLRVARIAFDVESTSTPGCVYAVALMVGDEGRRDYWTCECRDYIHRDRECKHVQSVKRWLVKARSVARGAAVVEAAGVGVVGDEGEGE